jgi:hypothetical protein
MASHLFPPLVTTALSILSIFGIFSSRSHILFINKLHTFARYRVAESSEGEETGQFAHL